MFVRPPKPDWVALVPAIPEARAASAARGEFYRFSSAVNIGDGPVWLASTPDGTGALRTDDRALLVVTREDGSARSWSRDFREERSGAIVSIPAQEVTGLFERGINTVTLALSDALPPVFSSSAYYLVFTPASASPGPSAGEARLTAVPVTPVAGASATAETAKRGERSDLEQVAALTATPIPVTGPIWIPTVVPTTGPVERPWAGWPAWQAPALGLAGLAAVFGALLAAGRRRRPQATLLGLLNVYDKNTRERLLNVDLTRLEERVQICLEPLSLSAARPSAEPPAPNTVLLLRDEAGILCVTQTAAGEVAKALMQDGDQLVIDDRVVLQYRNPFQGRSAAQADVTGIGRG